MRFFSLILTVALLCSVSFAQQATTPADSNSYAVNAAELGPAKQKFHKLSEPAKG